MLIRELAEDVSVERGPHGGTTVRFRVPVRFRGREGAEIHAR